MTHLYVDNFRGFSNTIIPFKSVNFLVGENSTGKSSILALINLLSSQDFWISRSFNQPEYEFGGFRDILSISSNRTKKFFFGVCFTMKHSKTKIKKKYGYMISFREKEALPVISSFARLDDLNLMVLKSYKEKYRYKIQKLNPNVKNFLPKDIFKLLRKKLDASFEEYKPLPKGVPSKAGFFYTIAMLEKISSQKKSDLNEIIFSIPVFAPQIVWFAPIRTRPKRTYDGYGHTFNPEGEHTPYLLRKKLKGKTAIDFRNAIYAFGNESGLFKKVVIKRFGEDAAAPFEILVELSDKCPLRINSVGYGVSQALPLVAEILERPKNTWFAIQQPEVHLHPKAQVALGDLIFQAAENENKNFFIETHSDFTLDRFRLSFKKNIQHKTNAQVLFFERKELGNRMSIIPVKTNGEYSDDQPDSFREFFLKEQMDLLGI